MRSHNSKTKNASSQIGKNIRSYQTPSRNACFAVVDRSGFNAGVIGLCKVALNVPLSTVLEINGLNSYVPGPGTSSFLP